MSKASFNGFRPDLIKFLDELSRNNNRKWFEKNKSRYEADLLEPSLEFIRAMERPLASVSPWFHAIAKRTGGSLMRIYRDTRFSKNKQPYKTNVGIHFRHERCKDVHAPGFYFHIEPDAVFVGAGIWRPDSSSLAKIRSHIDEQPARWKRASSGKTFRQSYHIQGEQLKRPPRGIDKDHPLIEDLKRKDFIAAADLDPDLLFKRTLVKEITAILKTARPYVRFLCEAVELPF